MKKLYAVLAFALVAFTVQAQLATVTVAVDMNDVAGFDPAEGVFVAGGFQGWAPMDGALSDDDGDGIWERTYDNIVPGNMELYKFGRGNDWGMNEGGGLADCGVDDNNGGFNRSFMVDADGGVFAFKYDSCEEVDFTSNVNELASIANVKVFPNPMTSAATIQFTALGGAAHDVIVSNLHGQVVREYANVRDNSLTIERQGMAAGMYFVTFRNEQGQTGTVRLMVQ